MKLQYNITSGSTATSLTESYTRLYASSTTYKISLANSVGGTNTTQTAWILKNGNVLAIDEAGTNLTGSVVQEMAVGLFAGFAAEVDVGSQLSTYTASQYFHSTGTSSATIGSNTFTVTNWAANKLPQTITTCSADQTTNLTTFALSVGVPKGTSYEIVTFMQIAGSTTINGQASNIDYLIKVSSFTVG
jgi:hypothetical protein